MSERRRSGMVADSVAISPADAPVLSAMVADVWPGGSDGWRLLPDLLPAGSPERTLQRAVLCGEDGCRVVLEGVALGKMAARQRQSEILQFWDDQGVPYILPWLKTVDGGWGRQWRGLFWQLRRWVDGHELPRGNYGRQEWRGQAAASFLVSMRQHGVEPAVISRQPFDLLAYIDRCMGLIQKDHPALHSDLVPLRCELEGLRQAGAEVPCGFCHGDFHPGNIIWCEQTIHAVIDWEFMGYKAEGYDAANLLGCLGMDDPDFLTGALATGFLRGLAQGGVLSSSSWAWLPELVAALRFAWMREWWWKKMPEMIVQELDFIWLILDNRDFLRKRWGELRGGGIDRLAESERV